VLGVRRGPGRKSLQGPPHQPGGLRGRKAGHEMRRGALRPMNNAGGADGEGTGKKVAMGARQTLLERIWKIRKALTSPILGRKKGGPGKKALIDLMK